MPELQPIRAELADAVLAFELANRAYFATSVPDRGETYYARFADLFDTLLVDQAAGKGAFYVLVDEDGDVVGRFNLEFVAAEVAELGYRVAQRVAGRGVATATVRQLCRLLAPRTVRAAAANANIASRKVLTKAGFVPVGQVELGGKPGTWFEWASVPAGR